MKRHLLCQTHPRPSIILLLVLCLSSTIVTQNTVIEHHSYPEQTEIAIETIFPGKNISVTAKKGDKPYYLILKNFRTVQVVVSQTESRGGKDLYKFVCSSYDAIICPLTGRKDFLENDTEGLLGTLKEDLKIELKNIGSDELNKDSLKLIRTEALKVKSKLLSQINFPTSIDDLHYLVRKPISSDKVHSANLVLDTDDFNKTDANLNPNHPSKQADTRIKFSLRRASGLKGNKDDIHNSSFLKMKVSQKFIDTGEMRMVKRYGITEGGSIVSVQSKGKKCLTFNKDSQDEINCLYVINIKSKNTAYASYHTEYLRYDMKFQVSPMWDMTDQVESNKPLTYELTLDNLSFKEYDEKPNWEFVLIPLEGDPDLFINADTNPELGNGFYTWESDNFQDQERVIITNNDCKKSKKSCKKFFIKVSTDDESPASFLILAFAKSRKTQFALDVNVPFSGHVKKGEIINFMVRLNPDMPQTIHANVDLVSNPGGNADLYIMDCKDIKSCFIDQSMIGKAAKLSKDKSNFFAFSNDVKDYDSVNFSMMIKPTEATVQNPNNEYYSKQNMFAVAVVGNSLNGHPHDDPDAETFFLRFTTSGFKSLLAEDEEKTFAIPTGIRKVVEFRSIRPVTNVQKLKFNFKVFSGDVNIYMKKGSESLDNSQYDEKIMIDNNAEDLDSHTTSFQITKAPNKDNITGTYSIWFEAENTALVEVKPEYVFTYQDGDNIPSKVLTVDSHFDRIIRRPSDLMKAKKYDEFRIPLNIVKGQTNEFVFRIENIVGHVKMCIVLDFKDLDNSKSCKELGGEEKTDYFILTTDNPYYQNHSEVHIRIEPIFKWRQKEVFNQIKSSPKVSEVGHIWFKYNFSVSTTNGVHNLGHGTPFFGNVQPDQPDYLVYKFFKTKDVKYNVVNFEVYNDQVDKHYPITVSARVNFNKFESFGSTSKHTLTKNLGTLILDNEYLEKSCQPYSEPVTEETQEAKPKETEEHLDICFVHIKVSSQKNVALNYRLSIAQSNKAFILTDQKYIRLPSPKYQNVTMQFPVKDSNEDVSISIYTDYKELKLNVKVYD